MRAYGSGNVFSKILIFFILTFGSSYIKAISESDLLVEQIQRIPPKFEDITSAVNIVYRVTQKSIDFIKQRANKFPKSPMLSDAAKNLEQVLYVLSSVQNSDLSENQKTSIRNNWTLLQKNRQQVFSQKFLLSKNAQAKHVFLSIVEALQSVIVDILNIDSDGASKKIPFQQPALPVQKPLPPMPAISINPINPIPTPKPNPIPPPKPIAAKPLLPLVPGLDFEDWLKRQNEADQNRFATIDYHQIGGKLVSPTPAGQAAYDEYRKKYSSSMPASP